MKNKLLGNIRSEFLFCTVITITPVSDDDMGSTDSTRHPQTEDCVDKLPVLLTTGIMGFFTALNTIVSFILFRKVIRKGT